MDATAELQRLVPQDAGWYEASAAPSGKDCFDLLRTKLLDPHESVARSSEIAPQVQLTDAQAGNAADLETRIDQPLLRPSTSHEKSTLETLLENTSIRAALQVQSTVRDNDGVFVRTDSAVALVAASDWNTPELQSDIAGFLRPTLTADELGVAWQSKPDYQQLDGLMPLYIAVRGNSLLLSNDASMLESMLGNFSRKTDEQPATFLAAFNHERERPNFVRLADLVDRPSGAGSAAAGAPPEFFSGIVASLSGSLAGVSRETVAIRGDAKQVRQTVTYEWSQ
jgi:hypothetical protein